MYRVQCLQVLQRRNDTWRKSCGDERLYYVVNYLLAGSVFAMACAKAQIAPMDVQRAATKDNEYDFLLTLAQLATGSPIQREIATLYITAMEEYTP